MLVKYSTYAGFRVIQWTLLKKAIKKIPYRLGKPKEIKITEGDILKINSDGERQTERFDTTKLYDFAYIPYSYRTNTRERATTKSYAKDEYIKQLKHEAECYGFSANYIDTLLKKQKNIKWAILGFVTTFTVLCISDCIAKSDWI